jgi:AcrR family transcriptional regulator
VATPKDETGRPAQRRRTRSAIIAAATDLLGAGKSPSVAEIAEAADVSRRTVYMYFPTLEHLLLDATLGTIAKSSVEQTVESLTHEPDIEARVEQLARALQRGAAETEQQGRRLLRLTAEASSDGGPRAHPPRGYRRVEWVERVLAPLRPTLGKKRFERLVSALVMVLGWESLIVQRDIRGLSLEESEDVSAWAALALLRATLAEAHDDTTRRSARAPGAAKRRGVATRAKRSSTKR